MNITRILAAVQVALLGYVIYRQRKMEKIMATVPAGLASLTQAEQDLAAAETAAVAQLVSLAAQLSALQSEDPQVATLAAQIEAQAKALQAATTPTA